MNISKLCDLLMSAVDDAGLEFGSGHGLTADYRTLYFNVLGANGKVITVSITHENGSTV